MSGGRKQSPYPNSPAAPQREPKPLRTPDEQRAEIERVAREHGADLSEEGFDTILSKVSRHKTADSK